MKFIIFLTLFFTIGMAAKMQVIADSFERNQLKGLSTFLGHVSIKKDLDELNASKVLIYVDDANHPIKYYASGDVSFTISTENNTTYVGRSQKLTFLPLESIYKFETDVFLRDGETSRTLSGESIHINIKTGDAKIIGKEKAPVRVTFDLEDDNTTVKTTGLNNINSKKNAVKEK